MLFNSFDFLCFLIVTLGLYYLPFWRFYQVHVLVAASFFFYAFECPALLGLLVACIGMNAWLSFKISKLGVQDRAGIFRFAVCGILFNVGLLATFKYGPLAVQLLPQGKSGLTVWLQHLPLPIGISFYTFENISLIIDVFRHRRRGEMSFTPTAGPTHLLHSALFVAFFPHLVSGPILKADTFFPQIGPPKLWRNIAWSDAFKAIVLGFFLKTVVADNLKEVTTLMNYPQFIGFSTLTLIVLLAGYSVQIFADFAGYSLIAIGLASLFGYKLPDNFNYPYLSSSLGEFWRRWHISLSGWLRDYLYFPLGGNRRGRLRTYFNLFLVMAIGGLWHGAAWSFVIWGLYHGLGLAFERWAEERWPDLSLRLPRWACVATVFIFVSFGWLLFRLPDFGHVIAYLRCLATNYSLGFVGQKKLLILVFVFSLPVFLLHAFKSMAAGGRIHCVASTVPAWLKYGLLVFAILVSYGLPGAFIYFQF